MGKAWGLTSDSLDCIYTWTVLAFYVLRSVESNPVNGNVLLLKFVFLWFFMRVSTICIFSSQKCLFIDIYCIFVFVNAYMCCEDGFRFTDLLYRKRGVFFFISFCSVCRLMLREESSVFPVIAKVKNSFRWWQCTGFFMLSFTVRLCFCVKVMLNSKWGWEGVYCVI